MAKKNRQSLKDYFQTGFKPTKDNFADVMDSNLNLIEEDLHPVVEAGNKRLGIGVESPQQRLDIGGAIKIGDTVSPAAQSTDLAGSIAFDNSDKKLKFHNGVDWKEVGSGTGNGSWQEVTTPVSNRVEFGQVAIGNVFDPNPLDNIDNSITFFSHKNFAGTYPAFVQRGDGITQFNAKDGQTIQFLIGGSNVLEIYDSTSNPNPDLSGSPLVKINGHLEVTGEGRINTSGAGTQPINQLIDSDERLKKDLAPFTKGLEQIRKLDPIIFRYNGLAGTSQKNNQIGLVAQHLQKIIPEIVSSRSAKLNPTDKEETNILQIDSGALTYLLINAVKELSNKVELLESKIATKSYTKDFS